ncbi:MAG: NAD(P)H-quinone oxidoreductase [Rhodospirillales bacterium]|nr:NAD(P)H-quinone oxidoreductase [Rhodospirillales bacterium]
MKVATIPRPGGPEVFKFIDLPKPVPGPEQLLVRVRGVGLNRADSLQRLGHYPMPPGVANVPGLELAGEVAAVGAKTKGFRKGDNVIGLVAEGAYAEYALVDYGLAVHMPKGWSFADGASVIEVFCTAHETVFILGELKRGGAMFLHAAASGVGTAALQMAKHAGAAVYGSAGTDAKVARLKKMGIDLAVNYKTTDFAEAVMQVTDAGGVDMVEDFSGGPSLARNLAILRETGRLVIVGALGGSDAELDSSPILRKRLKILGFTLRAQTLADKRAIVGRFRDLWLPLLAKGAIKPIVHAALPFAQVAKSHAMMDANENFGKIVLTID